MRYAWIEAHRDQFDVARMCRQLGVSRTGFYQWRKRPSSPRACADSLLDAHVAAIHAQRRRRYGRPRILLELQEQGLQVGHERVRKSLRRQGLRPVYRRPYRITTDSDHARPVAPNILGRRFDGWKPDQAWVGDITYIDTDQGWLYLACVMDLASRRIVGWSMSERMKADLVLKALQAACWQRKPPAGLIMHTDRGSQYASDRHRQLLQDFHITQSMSRVGNCWDNAPMESFFKTLKVERVYQTRYATRDQARLDIVDWIEGFYNRQRRHSAINYLTPVAADALMAA